MFSLHWENGIIYFFLKKKALQNLLSKSKLKKTDTYFKGLSVQNEKITKSVFATNAVSMGN